MFLYLGFVFLFVFVRFDLFYLLLCLAFVLKKKCRNKVVRVINVLFDTVVASCFCRFDTVYLDDDLRVVKDIRGDYLVVDRASYSWKE
jgi:hypothetical protein